jgi:hypothetical protein
VGKGGQRRSAQRVECSGVQHTVGSFGPRRVREHDRRAISGYVHSTAILHAPLPVSLRICLESSLFYPDSVVELHCARSMLHAFLGWADRCLTQTSPLCPLPFQVHHKGSTRLVYTPSAQRSTLQTPPIREAEPLLPSLLYLVVLLFMCDAYSQTSVP